MNSYWESFPSEDEREKRPALTHIKNTETLQNQGKILSALTILGEKPISEFDGESFIDSPSETEEKIESFAEKMNLAGVDCYFKITEYEAQIPESHDVMRVDNIWIDKSGELDQERVEKLELSSSKDEDYHELFGNTVGYEPENISQYGQDALIPSSNIETYKNEFDLTEEEVKALENLNFQCVRDSHDGRSNAVDRALTRKNALEEAEDKYNVDLLELIY